MNGKSGVLTILIAVEAVIYTAFILLDLIDLAPGLSNVLKYSGILLVFALALLVYLKNRSRQTFIIVSALFFTAVADIFLLFFSDTVSLIVVGLASFCTAQTLYAFFTTRGYRRINRVVQLIIPLVLSVGISLGAHLYFCFDLLTFLLLEFALYYAATFIFNLTRSWYDHSARSDRGALLFALGLTLFFMCDINVAIRNISLLFGMRIPETLSGIVSFLMWFFYLPSQVLIGISGRYSDKA